MIKTKQIVIRVNDTIKDYLNKRADYLGISVSELVRNIIIERLEDK